MTTSSLRRRGLLALVVAWLAFASVACSGDDGPDEGSGRLSVVGVATVTSPDGSVRSLAGDDDVPFGSIVEMTAGTASLETPTGATYELRAEGSAPTELEIDATPKLLAGDVLLADGFPVPLRVDLATVTARGATQVSAESPDVRVYAGRVAITGIEPLDGAERLRRVLLTPSARPEPIAFDPTDLWDRRYLGEADAFGDRLESLSRGYTNDLQPDPSRSVAFFEAILPGLAEERDFGEDLLDRDRPIGETLVGASIALAGREESFRQRWDAVFAFRDEGAGWGIVALSQNVSSTALLDTIELAIGTSPMSDDPRGSTTTTAPDTTSPTTTPTSGPATTTTTTTAPPTTVIPPPTTTPETGLLTPLLTPVSSILSELLSILGLG